MNIFKIGSAADKAAYEMEEAARQYRVELAEIRTLKTQVQQLKTELETLLEEAGGVPALADQINWIRKKQKELDEKFIVIPAR